MGSVTDFTLFRGDPLMKRFRLTLAAVLAPMLALALITVGCSKDENKGGGSTSEGAKSGDGAVKAEKTALEGKGRGTLRGKVTYDGNPPNLAAETASLQEKMKAKDEAHCLAMSATEEEKTAFEWRVDPKTGGVANVFVWLAPPEGTYFKLDDKDIVPAEKEVVVHQPHCAFIPHAAVVFPSYFDGKKEVPTGQKVIFKNDAEISHNTNYKAGSKGENILLSPGQSREIKLKPERSEITLSCDIHTWMRAYLRAFDHPFAAVTDKEGNYEIKNVPTGVDVQLVVWHEKANYVNGAKGEKVNLKDGDTKDFRISAK
jgi:hypothetical protein